MDVMSTLTANRSLRHGYILRGVATKNLAYSVNDLRPIDEN